MGFDSYEFATFNNLLKVSTACFAPANKADVAGTDIIDVATFSQNLQGLAKLARGNFLTRCVGNVKHLCLENLAVG